MLNSSARIRMKNERGNKSPRKGGNRSSISRMTRMAVIMWLGCCGFEAEVDAAIWN
jgi:hypothetical protein